MILVSACLLGCACRYDGRSKGHPLAQELARRGLAVPVCPEQLGGLATPRAPSEQREGRVVSAAGDDVTRQHSVAHELTHLRHGDHVWSLLRCVCLAVHWYLSLIHI